MAQDLDRVRTHTAKSVLRRIDAGTFDHLTRLAEGPPEAVRFPREELDREWDTGRTLEAEAATMALLGLALGTFVKPAFYAMPLTVVAGVLLQATTGRYPLMPLFRRSSLHTSKEIERERYALKAMRGDFDSLPHPGEEPAAERVRAVLAAVDA